MNKTVLSIAIPLRILTLIYEKDIFRTPNHSSDTSRFLIIYFIADIITSIKLKSYSYLLASMCLPLGCESIENLFMSIVGSNYIGDDILYYILCNFSIFYFPLSFQFLIDSIFIGLQDNSIHSRSLSKHRGFFRKSFISILVEKFDCKNLKKIFSNGNFVVSEYSKAYNSSHLPCMNITWFFFLHIFEQYSHLFFHYFYIIACYLIRSVKKKERFEIICMFRSSSFKNWLPIIHNDEYFHIYFVFYILFRYVDYLLNVEGLANPNFLNWISFCFISYFLALKYIRKISK